MASIRTEALILRSVEFGESDRILHLLVPEIGRLSAIAKGARRSVKRFAGTLDIFNHVSVQAECRPTASLARLDQAKLIEPFAALRVDAGRFALGCYLLELFDRLAPEGGVEADTRRLFSFAVGALRALTIRVPDTRLRTLLELRALDALGLRPELERCVRCATVLGGGAPIGFHVADGGVVCDRCATLGGEVIRVHPGTLRALERGLRFDLDQLDHLVISRASLAEARHLLGRFQRFHLGVELRSGRFLDQVLQAPDLG